MIGKETILALLGVSIILCGGRYGHAEEFPLGEYEQHVNRYLSSLENVYAELSVTDQLIGSGKGIREEHTIISMPKHFRVKSTLASGTDTRTTWHLLRPDGYYRIIEKGPEKFLLSGRAPDITSPLLIDDTNSPLKALVYPVCRGAIPLLHMLQGKIKGQDHRIADFGKSAASPGAVYTLRTVSRPLSNPSPAETEYQLNERWLVTRSTIVSREQGSRRSYEIVYTTLADRMLPSRIRIDFVNPSGKATAVLEFRNHKIYEGNAADFSLTQFGLPEAVDFQAPQGSRRWLYLLGAAIGLIVIAVVFRRLQQRSARLTPKTP